MPPADAARMAKSSSVRPSARSSFRPPVVRPSAVGPSSSVCRGAARRERARRRVVQEHHSQAGGEESGDEEDGEGLDAAQNAARQRLGRKLLRAGGKKRIGLWACASSSCRKEIMGRHLFELAQTPAGGKRGLILRWRKEAPAGRKGDYSWAQAASSSSCCRKNRKRRETSS